MDSPEIKVYAVNRAIQALAKEDEFAAKVVNARFFQGLTFQETGESLGVTAATVKRSWSTAKLFLLRELSQENEDDSVQEEGDTPKLVEGVSGCFVTLDVVDSSLLKAVQADVNLLMALDWRQFEKLLAYLLEKLGYEIELQRGTKDGGVDIFAIKRVDPLGPHKYLLQAKRSKHAIGVSPVRELLFLHQNFGVTRSCLATTSTFTRGARKLADEHLWQLELRDYEGIKLWVSAAV
jgi:hypothetical protein